MLTPEQEARIGIDALLTASGWHVKLFGGRDARHRPALIAARTSLVPPQTP